MSGLRPSESAIRPANGEARRAKSEVDEVTREESVIDSARPRERCRFISVLEIMPVS